MVTLINTRLKFVLNVINELSKNDDFHFLLHVIKKFYIIRNFKPLFQKFLQ